MNKFLALFLLLPNLAFAQISQQTLTNTIDNNITTNNQQFITGQVLQNVLNSMTSAIFQSQGLSGLTITGTPSIGQVPVATSSTTASWQTIGAVSTIVNNDGSLIFNPIFGNVVGSLNTAHTNTWTSQQTFNAGINLNNISLSNTYYSVFSCLSSAQIADVIARTKTIDLTSTLQSCLTNFGPLVSVFWPSGTYLISGTLTIPNNQNEVGTGLTWNNGSVIQAANNMNTSLFKFTNGGSAVGFSFLGSATNTTTSQYCNYVNNTNSVTLKSNFYANCYAGIYIDGSSFYISVLENVFVGNYAYQLQVNSITSAGVDLIHRGNRYFSATSTQTASISFDGLGSIISSDNQLSLNNPSTAMVLFNTRASLWGGGQFSNDVFENGGTTTAPAVYIKGATGASNHWNVLKFVNCIFTGGLGNAIEIDYADQPQFIGGNISSTNTGGDIVFPATGSVTDLIIDGVHFDQASGSITPIQGGGASFTLSASFTNSVWNGSASVISLNASTTVSYFNWTGGYSGSSTTPFGLPSGVIPGIAQSTGTGKIALSNGISYYDPNGGFVFSQNGSGSDPTISGSGNFLLLYQKGASGAQLRSAVYTSGSLTGWASLTINGNPIAFNNGTGTNVIFGGSSTAAGTVTYTASGGLQIGAPTGGDKGSGTINAAGIYYANGTAGASCTLTTVSHLTVVNGIVTLCN